MEIEFYDFEVVYVIVAFGIPVAIVVWAFAVMVLFMVADVVGLVDWWKRR